jgi:hypothetical protein
MNIIPSEVTCVHIEDRNMTGYMTQPSFGMKSCNFVRGWPSKNMEHLLLLFTYPSIHPSTTQIGPWPPLSSASSEASVEVP